MPIRELFIFRHGQTDWNAAGRFQGHIDVPMNETGREQARSLIEPLLGVRVQAILSSDLQRATETARIVAEGLGGLPLFRTPGLREAHLGSAQGLTRDEIVARFGEERISRWASSLPTDADVAYDGGESGAEVMQRVFKSIEQFIFENPEFKRIGISTHGGVVRRMMQRMLPPGSPPVRIPNCVLYAASFDTRQGVWRIQE